MQIDAIYPLGTGSKLHNEEIRYSIRSLMANAQNLGKIYIIGEKPKFLEFGERLIHIPYKEIHGPYRNTWEKLRVAAEDDRISEKFVWMNDDFYIVKKFDASNIPYYTRGGTLLSMRSGTRFLKDLQIADIHQSYHRCLKNTLTALLKRKLPTFAFATHQPVNFEKKKVLALYREFRHELQPPYGLSFRCCYGNFYRLPYVVRPTYIVKQRWQIPPGRLAFATHKDVDPNLFRRKLAVMFPNRSIFERSAAAE